MREYQKKRYTIAIMLGDMQSDYSGELLRGFYTCAQKEDVNIVFLMGPRIPQYCTDVFATDSEGDYSYQFDTVYAYAHFTKPDALIITYAALAYYNTREEKEAFLNQYADIPYLMIGEKLDGYPAPYMMSDNYKGMCTCIEHLVVDHGYRKIAFLSGPKSNMDAVERIQAYCDVMEEHNLPVSDTMIAYGDYSVHVKRQVKYLLDNNPGLEAIVCANDNMAKCCYQVCSARSLRVGKDIAITGFDDVELARTMDPLLTSVSQNGFQFSYNALRNAITLCEKRVMFEQRLPVNIHIRESCGCDYGKKKSLVFADRKEKEHYIIRAMSVISTELLSSIPYQEERNHYSGLILDYFNHIYKTICCQNGEAVNLEYLMDILQEITDFDHMSISLLLENLTNLMQVLITNAENAKEQEQLMMVLDTTRQYIHFANVSKLEQEVIDSNRKNWFVPTLVQDLSGIATEDGFTKALIYIMKRFRTMRIKSCYIYLYDTPIIHKGGMDPDFPEKIYLSSWFLGEEMVCYKKEERPCVTMKNGFTSFINSENPMALTAVVLFSGDKQYGMMLCEAAQQDIPFLQLCSLQVGPLLRFLELNQMERESQKELQKSLRTIQEQNDILSFVSEYDELTQLLNRRGFMERSIRSCQQGVGKKAFLIFGDLDHLKEINDCYGHAAGDFAIRGVANQLREILPADAITARIGGDEFISLVFSEREDFRCAAMEDLHIVSERFNRSSKKPYYVEISIGIYEFRCNPDTDLNELIQKSDELLYQAKVRRRKSVKKSPEVLIAEG